MEYLVLFVIAAVSHTGQARSWGGGYDYDYPVGNHQNFNYHSWCHSAGGWPEESWEDSSSESQEWNDKNRFTRSTSTTTGVVITKTQSQTSTISVRVASPSSLDILFCLRSCPVTPEYNPVCGTDDITYWNMGRLQCATSCGVNVGLKRASACVGGGQQTSSTTTTPSPQVIATCMRSCSVTSEYNPVCGTDNITYNNPSRLECAKACGKSVTLRVPSRCPPPDEFTSTTTTVASTFSTSTTPMVFTSGSEVTEPSKTVDNTVSSHILDAIFNGNSTSTTESLPDFSLDERYEK